MKIKDYVDLNNRTLCPHLAERLIKIVGVEFFCEFVGITDNAYRSKKKRAVKKGTYHTEMIIVIFAFLRDNNVSDDELMGVINV